VYPCSTTQTRTRVGLAILVVVAAATTAPVSILAQGVPTRDDAIEIRKQFLADLDTLSSKFTALANAFPDDKYSWRPGPGVRSVGEVFLHVASEYYVYVPLSYGANRSPVIPKGQGELAKFEKGSTKAEVLKHLAAGREYAATALKGLDPNSLVGTKHVFGGDYTIVQLSFNNTDDLHEHLGQLIAYARMNGIAPPWSTK
jgi:hypothetical protein